MRLFVRTALFLLLVFNGWLRAAEYQWSVPMEPTIPDPAVHPRAFLWIPPTCQHVRAVVLGQQGLLEEGLFDSPEFRQAMADLDFAIVWVSPAFDPDFRSELGAGERVKAMLKALAADSGYGEIEFEAPIVTVGDSAFSTYPWNFAAWNPGRTLAVISLQSDSPLSKGTDSGMSKPDWGKRSLDGIPGLMLRDDRQWNINVFGPVYDFNKEHPGVPLSVIYYGSRRAFDYPNGLASLLALFLRKAALARLPENPISGPVFLKPVDPNEGWRPAQMGEVEPAFWLFDQEMGEAVDHFEPDSAGKLPQVLSFEQDGATVSGTSRPVMLNLETLPDGISFHLKGVIKGDHATGGGPVIVSRISGPAIQTGPDTWAVHFYRGSDVTDYAKMNDQIWLMEKQAGDDKYQSADERGVMTIPMHNLQGSDQHIDFPAIPNQTNATGYLKLAASSDSGLPVSYYVREGPAEIEGNTLVFTPVPPRAKYPIKVTVVAWQYGSPTSPRVKSAEPVTQVITITR